MNLFLLLAGCLRQDLPTEQDIYESMTANDGDFMDICDGFPEELEKYEDNFSHNKAECANGLDGDMWALGWGARNHFDDEGYRYNSITKGTIYIGAPALKAPYQEGQVKLVHYDLETNPDQRYVKGVYQYGPTFYLTYYDGRSADGTGMCEATRVIESTYDDIEFAVSIDLSAYFYYNGDTLIAGAYFGNDMISVDSTTDPDLIRSIQKICEPSETMVTVANKIIAGEELKESKVSWIDTMHLDADVTSSDFPVSPDFPVAGYPIKVATARGE
jgi:hypothetical protein